MPEKSKHPTPAKSAKKSGQFSGEPIFIQVEPPEDNPLPQEIPAWPKFFLTGGLILALFCAWWFAPVQLNAFLKNLLGTLIH